jgi:hypothetical protein
MKTKVGILTMSLLLACLFTAAKEKATALLSSQSMTELGSYTIQESSKALKIGDEALKTYELSYTNSDTPVLIGVKKTKKCMNFIVRTANFEMEYVCNKHVFGVKRVNQNYQTIPAEKINAMLDNSDYFRQRVISQNPKTEPELLGLIACYFPSLIREEYLAKL